MMIELNTPVAPILRLRRWCLLMSRFGTWLNREDRCGGALAWLPSAVSHTALGAVCALTCVAGSPSLAQSQSPRFPQHDVPQHDLQPASPWAKPFPAPNTMGTPPSRHDVTQHDSAGTPPAGPNRVPEGGVPATLAAHAKNRLAQQISYELVSRTHTPEPRSLVPLEPPPGWHSIESDLKRSIESCEQLLRRGAIQSARQDAIHGLQRLARTIDMHRQIRESEPALQQALVALKESGDFDEVTQDVSLTHTISRHTTPVLKQRDLATISPDIAAQHYRAYARSAFLASAQSHPWAADLLYTLGRTYEKEGELASHRRTQFHQAVVCYQAANAIAPSRPYIASQLGHALLQLDRTQEATQALHASLASAPTSQAWRDLAEAHRRHGEYSHAQAAAEHAEQLAAKETSFTAENPEITQVTPEVFAQYSPPPAYPNASLAPTHAAQGMGTNHPPSPAAPPTPTASRNWLPKIFR